jgi:hypothetical protein
MLKNEIEKKNKKKPKSTLENHPNIHVLKPGLPHTRQIKQIIKLNFPTNNSIFFCSN